MPIDPVGEVLQRARNRLGISQADLGRRVGVSTRLVSEMERGERPNVSLATALRVLDEAGVTLRLTEASGSSIELGDPQRRAIARAAARRATWTGRMIRLDQDDDEAPASPDARDRVLAVAEVSRQAFSIARGNASARKPASRREPGTRSR